MLALVDTIVVEKGLMLKTGWVVNAKLMAAPGSIQPNSGKCDQEKHRIQKGGIWSFGMKARVGVDEESALVHTVIGMSANVYGIQESEVSMKSE